MSVSEFYEAMIKNEELSRLGRFKKSVTNLYRQRPDLYLVFLMFIFMVLTAIVTALIFMLDWQITLGAVVVEFFFFMGIMAAGKPLNHLTIGGKQTIQFELIDRSGKYITTAPYEDVILGALVIDRKMPLFDQVVNYLYDQYKKSSRIPDFIRNEQSKISKKNLSLFQQLKHWAIENKYNVDEKAINKKVDEEKNKAKTEEKPFTKKIEENVSYNILYNEIEKQRNERIELIKTLTSEKELESAVDKHEWLEKPVFDLQLHEIKQYFEEVANTEIFSDLGEKFKTIALQFRGGYESPKNENLNLKWLFCLVQEREDELIDNYNWDRIFPKATREIMISLGWSDYDNVIKADFRILGYWRVYPVVSVIQREDTASLSISNFKEQLQMDEIWFGARLLEIIKEKEAELLEKEELIDDLILSKLESSQRAERIRELLHKSRMFRDRMDIFFVVLMTFISTYFLFAMMARVFNLRFF